jgi:type IV pilus assembly protein PilE
MALISSKGCFIKLQNRLEQPDIDMTKHSQGFTLIELIVVIGIVAILSTVAVAWYGDNVTRAKRTEAKAAISETAGSLEKCKGMYGTYDNANCNVVFPVLTESNLYAVTVVRDASTFTLTATPIPGQRQASDADCTSFTLTNTGQRTATGADTTKCW